MISLIDILTEKVDTSDVKWHSKSYEKLEDFNFPLTPRIAKILNAETTTHAFHITSYDRIDQLKSLEGSKKSISCMTIVPRRVTEDLDGVHEGGLMYYVEGKLVINALSDIMSAPDENGRRWIPMFDAYNLYDKFKEYVRNGYDQQLTGYFDKLEEKGYWSEMKDNFTNKEIANFIKLYIEASTIFAELNAEKIVKAASKHRTDYDEGYNEVLLNEIKLVDVVYDLTSYNLKQTESDPNKAKQKVESSVSGVAIPVELKGDDSVMFEKGQKTVEKFIKEREGKMTKGYRW